MKPPLLILPSLFLLLLLAGVPVPQGPSPDRSWTGETARDRFGQSVATAGDLDLDGHDDLIVGAEAWDGPAGGNAGRVYVLSGASGSALWTFDGEAAGDGLGGNVNGAGDVNGDGIPDIVAGAPAHHGGRTSVYLWSGADGSLLYSFTGVAPGDEFGFAVAGVGDVNGDGYADVAATANRSDANGTDSGAAYVYSGADGSLLYLLVGEVAGDRYGDDVEGLGDIDGDGHADFFVGASRHDAGHTDTGRAYVYSGRTGVALFLLDGEDSYDYFACTGGNAGDVNCDGVNDIILGAGGHDGPSGPDQGRVYVYSGADGSLLRQWDGEAGMDVFGIAVAGNCDWNGDRFSDVLVAAFMADAPGAADAGRVYVFSGLDGSVLATFEGAGAGDNFGNSLYRAGDLDGDGFDDLVVGSAQDDSFDVDAGAAYAWYGARYRLDVDDLVVGQVATATVSGGTPDACTIVVGGFDCGMTPVPQLGVNLAVSQPVIQRRARADVNGATTFAVQVGPNQLGRTWWIQAAEMGRASNVRVRVVQ